MERDRYIHTIKFWCDVTKLRIAIRDVLCATKGEEYVYNSRKGKNEVNKTMLNIISPVAEKHIREKYEDEFEVEYKIKDNYIDGEVFFTLPPMEIYATANRRIEEVKYWVRMMEYEEGFMRGLQEGFRAWKAGVLNAKN